MVIVAVTVPPPAGISEHEPVGVPVISPQVVLITALLILLEASPVADVLAALVALIVTVSIKWVGMLIINSLLVLPAAAAKNIVKSMRAYHIVSVLFSLFSGICGLVLSYYIGTSAGATIVLISSTIFFGTFFINRFYKPNNRGM